MRRATCALIGWSGGEAADVPRCSGAESAASAGAAIKEP
ncbi:MAG: hypothetical protein AVDCRST_MAG19-4341 [uncultured Thermomicrobiales bacterium]|uniref:Uncharacterized protein n=1 Tax=uncultured Thermomicrobiales bacterium TaxID=1645740 RepID=A0A6J4VNS5_9BACT|nr:MAG: hypothetical protein AVDCRST_MAG19-4341 [uncultured Thermomicrobiales bacterium]